MRPQYLLLVGLDRDAADRAVEFGVGQLALDLVHRTARVALLANEAAGAILLPERRGAIVGHLFHRHGMPERVRRLPEGAALAIAETAGRHLVERFWGNYVAVIEGQGEGTCVLRDPGGGLACYHAPLADGLAFASDAPVLIDLRAKPVSIDWRQLGRALYLHHLPAEDTAIAGLTQLLPGCALCVADRRAVPQKPYWTPWDHVAPRGSCAADPAARPSHERLQQAVRSAIAAWGACFERPVVAVSGGLDSSIVAACLADRRSDFACLTLTTADPHGDERRYARELCAALGVALAELSYDAGEIDLDRSVAAGVPVPCGKLHEQSYNHAVRRALAQLGGDVFMGGAGGDNVFYATHSARPLVDRYDAQGWSRGLLTTLEDIAAITGASLWTIVREAYRLTHPRAQGMSWTSLPDYLSRDFVEAEAHQPITHPWFTLDRPVALGKLGHVKLVLRAMNHLEHRDKALAAPMISPLLSQPVVETCLAIPSWNFVAGGVDRAVARHAFARLLPPAITARNAKGSPEGFVGQFIESRRGAIAARLLDGAMIRQGLVDRPALDAMLRADGRLGAGDCARLMSLLDTEAWIAHWTRAPAAARLS